MKNSPYDTLRTKYIENMHKECPWSDYPRPSMKRDSYMSLNGKWDFALTNDGGAPDFKDTILVPFPPESLLSGIQKEIPRGATMYYRRRFSIPEQFHGRRLLLHFGAVDTKTEVYIGNKRIGEHIGGYLPFSLDITDAIERGENELIVKAIDTLSPIYPYGKQTHRRGGMWYTPVSGIWQSVWLEAVPEKYIQKLKITPTTESVSIEVVGGENEKRLTLEDGSVYEFVGNKVTVIPENIELWTPENPKLYSFTLEAGEDRVESYFALREVSIRTVDGIPRICLNGEPYLFNGLLDQGYYPDGIFLPATAKGYEDDITVCKSLGFNMLRKHIKIEPEIFYYLCDRIGMVVFQDMVNNAPYSFFFDTVLPTVGMKKFPDKHLHKNPESRRAFIEHMTGTIEHLYSFPSILYYTIFNEGWGQFSADNVYRIAKSLDGTRVIDATSGWFIQKESDVDSHHIYFKPINIKKRSNRPIVISEFGGYSHRVEGHLFGKDNYGYKIFEKKEDFEDAFLRLYENEVLPTIPYGVSALVYTQVSDVEDETNGILTYDRRVLKLTPERVLPLMEELKSKIR